MLYTWFNCNCTCCNITYIPHSQAFLLSPKGIDEGQVGATRGTEQHTLFTGDKVRLTTLTTTFHTHGKIYPHHKLTIFISRECTRLGLLPKMSQIFTCLSAEEVTMHPLIWLLRDNPAGIQRVRHDSYSTVTTVTLRSSGSEGSVTHKCVYVFLQKGNGFGKMMEKQANHRFSHVSLVCMKNLKQCFHIFQVTHDQKKNHHFLTQ